MWVRFTAVFRFVPDEDRRLCVKYPADIVGNVRRQCGERAIAAGKAERHTLEHRS